MMLIANKTLSLIEDYAMNSSSCGYCHSHHESSVSHGMSVASMSVETYQELLDRGWRRSGKWMYRPVHERTCCQLITIRLDVNKYQPSKGQRKVMKKWKSVLEGAPYQVGSSSGQMPEAATDDPLLAGGSPKRAFDDMYNNPYSPSSEGKKKRFRGSYMSLDQLEAEQQQEAAVPANSSAAQLKRPPSISNQLTTIHLYGSTAANIEDGTAVNPSKPIAKPSIDDLCGQAQMAVTVALQECVAAGSLPVLEYPLVKVQVAKQKQKQMLGERVVGTTSFPQVVAGMSHRSGAAVGADNVAEVLFKQLKAPQGLVAQVSKGHLNFSVPEAATNTTNDNKPAASKPPLATPPRQPEKQQQHPDTNTTVATGASPSIPRSVPRHFEFRVCVSTDPSLIASEFELFRKYQIMHHKDEPADVTTRGFKRFLCDTPLRYAPAENYPPGAAPPGGFGSFHQQYILDGRLIAVGVVDVLPKCLSSKYLFWDPELAALSLGKLTSIKEIEWVQKAASSCSSLHYYYMGYYVHNCHRMRYKADFQPSDLLCPVSNCWVPISRVQSALEQAGRPNLSAVPGALEGLDSEYLVDSTTHQPLSPPRELTDEELDSAALFIPLGSPSSPGSPTDHHHQQQHTANGQMVTFGQLCQLEVLQKSSQQRLKKRIQVWAKQVGPAWKSMVYHL